MSSLGILGGGVPSSITKQVGLRGGGGVKFSGKKRYVTLEWPLRTYI